jgi:hypothetical protein
MKAEGGQRDSFLVRIWRDRGKPEWKGWVQHTRSGESALLHSRAELLAFLEHHTGELPDPPRKGLR